jgi:hypothetical protein
METFLSIVKPFLKSYKKLRLTFRLFTTFWPAYKAMRSIAAGQNVGGVSRGSGA